MSDKRPRHMIFASELLSVEQLAQPDKYRQLCSNVVGLALDSIEVRLSYLEFMDQSVIDWIHVWLPCRLRSAIGQITISVEPKVQS